MTENLFNPEAFEQMPGQMSMEAVRVDSLVGEVIESAEVDGQWLEIVRFMVPNPAGGTAKPRLIAYFDREYCFPVAS